MGMNSTIPFFTDNDSKSGTPFHSDKMKRKQNHFKKFKEMYCIQTNYQNENRDIKSHSDCLESSVSNDTNKSNRSRDKCVSEMKGKKSKVRLQNNHLAASAICNDYLSKKLNSVGGLPKIDSKQGTISDKDDTDVFFFDLSGNKMSCSSDSKTNSKNNGSVLSLSPQDVVSLRKNKQKLKKNNISKQKYSNDVNYSDNFFDIRDGDEMIANGNDSLSRRPSEMKSQIQSNCSDSSSSKSFAQNEIMGESSNQRSVKKKRSENKAKKSKSKENKKIAFEFEKSFETLLKYYTAQSTPIQSENEDHLQSNSKEFPKVMNSDDLDVDEIYDKKKRRGVEEETKKKHKRRRSNSGDLIHLFTSSSDENKEREKEIDISLNVKRKKRKSGHNVQQSEPDISLVYNEICTAEHNNIDFSDSKLMNNFKKQKKKKDRVEHSTLYISSEDKEIDKDTGKNHNRKHHKSKSFDDPKLNNELKTGSDIFELDSSYSSKNAPVDDMSSENMKTRGGEKSFLQRPDDEQELYSLKSNEFKRKKHKRKQCESKCINGAEMKCKSENDSVDEVFSTENIDEQRVESPANTKTIYAKKYGKTKLIRETVSKNKLEIDSVDCELNISHKKRRHKEINAVGNTSSTSQEPDKLKWDCQDSMRNYTEKLKEPGSTGHEEYKNECKIEFSDSELDLSHLFTEKKSKYSEDVSSIETYEKSTSVLEEHSRSKSKKKKKHKADSSLDDLSIFAEENIPTKRKNVSPNLIDYEDFQSQNKTTERETSLNHSFEKKKRMKKLNNISDNGQKSLKQLSKWRIPDSIYEFDFENHILTNEMNSTSPVLESDMNKLQNFERLQLGKNKSNTITEHNEETTNTVHELDWNMGSPNMKEEIDISDTDLKKFNKSKRSEKSRCRNIRRINKDILSNMDSEHDGAEVLINLNIALPFTIPPLHINLERPSKPSLNEINASRNFEVKRGAYSKEEDQIIKNNWERFCKEHNLNIEPSAFFKFPQKMRMEEKIKFLQYISHGLENRLPHRVHHRFKTLFGNMVQKTGRFTEEEDKQILEFMEMESSKTPFTDLARILNRPSNSIERHYKRHYDQQNLVWTPSKADQLINCMLKVAKLEKPEQLKDCKFTTKQWKKISKKMEGVPVIKLQRAWNITIYPRLFASGNLALAKKQIIDILDKQQETDWRLIDWKEISKKFPGFSPEKLYMMFKKLVIFNVPNHHQKDIKKCIECLKDKRIATPHKFRKYEYKNGHLVYGNSSEDDNFTI